MSTNNEVVAVEVDVASYAYTMSTYSTTSARIRYLSSLYPTKEISKILNIRYQHVRNVLKQELKKTN